MSLRWYNGACMPCEDIEPAPRCHEQLSKCAEVMRSLHWTCQNCPHPHMLTSQLGCRGVPTCIEPYCCLRHAAPIAPKL